MEPVGIAFGVLSAIVSAMGGPSAIIGKITGAIFGEKGAEAAGKVVESATKAFGTTDPEQIKLQIAQDQSKLQAFVAQADADTKAYQIEVDDRKDARARDLELRKLVDEKGVPAGTNARANVMLIGAFICLLAVLTGTIWFRQSLPDSIVGILQSTVGSLLTVITLAFNFEFGSSRGSAETRTTLQNFADTASKK